jgi:hypothetical protein
MPPPTLHLWSVAWVKTAELTVGARGRCQKSIATAIILNARTGSNSRASFRLHLRTTVGSSPKPEGEACSNQRGSLVSAN